MTEDTSELDKITVNAQAPEKSKKTAPRRRKPTGSDPAAEIAAASEKPAAKRSVAKQGTSKAPAKARPKPRSGGAATAFGKHEACEEALFNLPVGVAAFDRDDRLIFANEKFYEVFDVSRETFRPGLLVFEIMKRVQEMHLFAEGQDVERMALAVRRLKSGETRENLLKLASGNVIEQKVRKLADGSWVSVLTDQTARIRAEEQAHEAEYRWSFALESARQGVWDSNIATGQMFYSHMWREIRGLDDVPDEKLTREFWLERLHPEDSEMAQDFIRRQDEGETFENGFVYRERHANGDWIWIQSRGRAVAWNADGKPTRIIGTDTDITETRNTQLALSEAESRWNFALKGTGQGVWDCDVQTRRMYYSPTWRLMRGVGLDEEVDGDPELWLERVHPDDRERLREIVRKQDAGEIPFNAFEYREKHRAGHYIWIQSRGEPVAWDEQGRPSRIIGIDLDITAQKELELKVKENLQLLNATLDNFPGGLCMYDKNLILTVANKRYYENNKIDPDRFPVGTSLEDILREHARLGHYGAIDDIDAFLAERMEDARAFTPAQFIMTSVDGQSTEYDRTPMDGGGFVMTFTDVTERIRNQNEKAVLERELAQAQRLESLGTLASGIAHEINTPIQYVGDNLRFIAQCLRDMLQILQFCRRAMRVPVDPGLIAERATELEDMEKLLDLEFLLTELPLAIDQSAQGIQQVTRIVKAVREFSHPGHDEKTEFDINAIIETTLIVSKNQWKYFAEVETDLDRSLPQIKCLPGEMGQVILNLVVNAAHAIEAAERENGLIRIATRRDDDILIIEVTDNGCGIPDDIKNRIYDPFFTTKDIGHGTGQGLSIAFNAVVNKHRGTIDCDSRVGEGTTFTIAIPIEGDPEQATEAAQA